jgi:hypothetical protein
MRIEIQNYLYRVSADVGLLVPIGGSDAYGGIVAQPT